MSIVTIGNDWDKLLRESFESDWYQELRQFLIDEYTNETIYPNMYDLYNAHIITFTLNFIYTLV